MVKNIALVAFLASALTGSLAGQAAMTIPAIVRRAAGAVVLVEGRSGDGTTVYDGTGFLVRSDGVVVTNYHVIAQDATAVVKLPNGAFFPVVGLLAADAKRDIAILKVNGTGLRTLTLGNSDGVQVGQEVVAIGNPLSLESSVSSGIVSGLRQYPSLGGGFLQVTTPISHGSSGGPLFDVHGRVIGITTMYFRGGENLNFAIPINDLKALLEHESAQAEPLPGGAAARTVPVSQLASPTGGCTIGGAQQTADFCAGYQAGYDVGQRAGFLEASIPARPAGKPSLYVDDTVSNGDTVGATFVYDLRSAIASSPLYTLAPDASAAAFDIVVVTVSNDDGAGTAGAVVIECGGSVAVGCAQGQGVSAFAFVAGSNAVGREAQNFMASIDQAIRSLPSWQH